MTQTESILQYLEENKTITPLEALEKFGCFRLASRISEIRKMGKDVVTQIIGNKDKHFARYNLVN